MALQELAPTGADALVQRTTLAIDAVARNLCNTWDEAVGSGGPPFTAVVVGSGAYGGYLAAKIVDFHPTARVLVLEAGPFLISEHVQNLGDVGLNVAAPIPPANDTGVARELVWGMPWRGNVDFPGLAYCCGGKSLFWGGWCPRLTPDDLTAWPAAAAAYLNDQYAVVESETGVVPATDFIMGDLLDVLWARSTAVAGLVQNLDATLPGGPVQTAPIAVQGGAPASGLFSFDKYSSMPILAKAIRTDVARSGGSDAQRRLFLVPGAHVVRLHASGGKAHTIEVDVDGVRKLLPIGAANVVLAASAIETTRLALISFPAPLMGRNLMAHIRSDFTIRIRRSALPAIPGHVQTAALLLRGRAAGAPFHLQLTASTSRAGSDAMLYQMVPDLDLLDQQLANSDPDWITITLRGIGAMTGERTTPVPSPSTSWINLSPFESDEYGVARAFVNLRTSAADNALWTAMDQSALDFVQRLAGTSGNIEYLYDGGWQLAPPLLTRAFPPWHWGLGTTYHEAGTLWMGSDPMTSVCDATGRLHHIANVYVGDQAVFPTVGSVNPVLTGLTLARRLAEQLG
jgi:choline dehydrogenase-like flavoprotein